MAQLVMASMAGLRGSSQVVLEGGLRFNRFSTGNTTRIAMATPGFSIRAQQQISTETSRRALLGLGAAGVVSGSFVQAVLAEPVGGYVPIPDPKGPEVVKVAKFAVAEHNKEAHTSLEFSSVDKGSTQLVAGINYKLYISATDGGARSNTYLAVVYSKPWEDILKLVSFEKLIG